MRNISNKLHIILLFWLLTSIAISNKVLKIIKEAIVLTSPDLGVILLPFLKLWVAVPASCLLLLLFHWLRRRHSLYRVMQYFTAGFLGFFFIFLVVLYPQLDRLQGDITGWVVSAEYRPFVLMLGYWPSSLLFVLGDMWSTMLLSVLFWNVAALVLSAQEAKRCYPWYSLDIAGIGVGLLGYLFVGCVESLLTAVIALGIGQLLLVRCLETRYPMQPTRAVSKGAIGEGWRSPVVMLFGLTVFSYEFLNNFLQVVWKGKVAELHSSIAGYASYMTNFSFVMGIVGMITALLMVRPLIQRGFWRLCALVTPVFTLVSAMAFMVMLQGDHSLQAVVMTGAVMSCGMQVFKYTFFDNAKELGMRSLDDEERVQTKAFADGIMTNVGRSGAALCLQMLFIVVGGLSGTLMVWCGGCLIVVVMLWALAIQFLNPYLQGRYAHTPSY